MRKKIIPYFPETDTLVSPFLGGAKIEIELAKRGVQVIANDADTAVINVWRNFQERKDELLGRLEEYYLNTSREHTKELLAEYKEEGFLDGLESAAKYLALNASAAKGIMGRARCNLKSRTILTASGMQRNYFHSGLLERLARLDYRPFKLYNEDWETFINRQDQSLFSYLDPPYFEVVRPGGYEHEFEFGDHYQLYQYLKGRENFCLSYGSHKQLLEWYDTEEFLVTFFKYHSTTKNGKRLSGDGRIDLLIRKNIGK